MLRGNTRDLCAGVVLAIVIFGAALSWLAWSLWPVSRGASVLVWLEVLFCGFAAWAFGAGSVRFFKTYKY